MGFSYADVSSELGTTKAALHYHFAGKAELGESLISRYNERFDAALAAIDATDMSAPRQASGLLRPLSRHSPRPADVPVRDAGRRVQRPWGADARGYRQVFRPQPGVAGRPPRDWSQGRDPSVLLDR
jgi:AcrR family transcriptional regulator